MPIFCGVLIKIKWTIAMESKISKQSRNLTIAQKCAFEHTRKMEKLVVAGKKKTSRTLANVQMMTVMSDLLPYYKTFGDGTSPDGAVSSVDVTNSRYKHCWDLVTKDLPVVMTATFIQEVFLPNGAEAVKKVKEMLTEILEAMYDMISSAKWLDKKTMDDALHKLAQVGSQVHLDPDDFVKNAMKLKHVLYRLLIRQLTEPFSRLAWNLNYGDAVISPNAMYHPTYNQIYIIAPILYEPYFYTAAPSFYNFARLGSTVGHEITHGFDSSGRRFDSQGHFKNWWTEEADKQYLERQKCIVDQYGSITDPVIGLKLLGDNIKGENIADNGGIKAAYLGYQKWLKKHRDSLSSAFDTFERSPNELFFIAYAQGWCNMGTEKMRTLVFHSDHALNEYRVTVPLQNFDEFSKVFECPVGSFMNPKKKCTVW